MLCTLCTLWMYTLNFNEVWNINKFSSLNICFLFASFLGPWQDYYLLWTVMTCLLFSAVFFTVVCVPVRWGPTMRAKRHFWTCFWETTWCITCTIRPISSSQSQPFQRVRQTMSGQDISITSVRCLSISQPGFSIGIIFNSVHLNRTKVLACAIL